MTTLTVKFEGVQEKILDSITANGIAQTKSEAIRMALLKFALDTGIIDVRELVKSIRDNLSGSSKSPEVILTEIESVKNETISG